MYSQEQCTSNDNIPYDNGGNLDYCFDGTTGCDCTDECGGNAQIDDCGICNGDGYTDICLYTENCNNTKIPLPIIAF